MSAGTLEFMLSVKNAAQAEADVQSFKDAVDGLGKSASNVQAPVSSASKAVSDLGKNSATSSSVIDKATSSAEDFGSAAGNTAKQTTGLKSAFSNLGGAIHSSAASFALAGDASWRLFEAFDSLEKIEVASSRSTLNVQRAQDQLANATDKLNKMQNDGKSSAADLAKQQEQVRLAQEKLSVVTQNNQRIQGDLNEAYVHFAQSVGPIAIEAGVAINGLWSNLSKNSGALKAGVTGVIGAFGNLGNSMKNSVGSLVSFKDGVAGLPGVLTVAKASTIGLSEGMATMPAAASGASLGVKGLTISIKGLQFTLGPIGIALIAITTLMTALATNAFGIRDAVNSAGKALGDMLPILRPVLGVLQEFGRMLGLTDDAANSAADAQKNFSDTSSELSGAAKAAAQNLQGEQAALAALGNQQQKNLDDAVTYLQSTKDFKDLAGLTVTQLLSLAQAHKKVDNEQISNLATQEELVKKYADWGVIHKALASGTFPALFAQLKKFDDEQEASKKDSDKQAEALRNTKSILEDLADTYAKNATAAQRLADQLGINTDGILKNQQEQSIWGQAMAEVQDTLLKQTDAVRAHAEALATLHPQYLKNIDVVHGSIDAVTDWTARTEDSLKAMDDAKEKLFQLSNASKDHADANRLIIQTLDPLVNVTKLSADQLQVLAQAELDAKSQADKNNVSLLAEAKAAGFVGDITQATTAQLKTFVNAHKEEEKVVKDVTSALTDWTIKIAESAAKGAVLAQQLGITDRAFLSNAQNLNVLDQGIDDYIATSKGAEAATRAGALALQLMHPQLAQTIDVFNASLPAVQAYIDSMKEFDDAVRQAPKIIREMNEPFAANRQLNVQLAEAFGLTADASRLTNIQLESLVRQMQALTTGAAENFESLVTEATQLGFMGDVTKVTKEQLQAFIDKQKAAKDAADKAQEATAKYKEELSQLNPRLQALLQQQGLLNNAMAGMTGVGARIVSAVKRVQSAYESARVAAEDFAIAHGTSIVKAASLSDAALLKNITSMAKHDAQQQIKADKARRAAQQYADAWTTALDKVDNQLKEASSVFSEAFKDFQKDFTNTTVIQTVNDFWNKLIPTDFIKAHFEDATKGVRDSIQTFANLAKKEVSDTMGKVVGGLQFKGPLSGSQAADFFAPFEKELNALPKTMAGAFGAAVAAAEHFSEALKPALLGGIVEVGPDAKKFIKTNFEDKMVDALQDSKGQLGNSFIKSVQGAIDALKQKNPDAAAFIQEQLKLAGPAVQDQVRVLLSTLDQVDPGFKDMIMKIDSDGDGIADIMDKKFNNPMEDFKNSTVDAFKQVIQQLSKLPPALNNVATSVAGMGGKFQGNISALGSAVLETNSKIRDMKNAAAESFLAFGKHSAQISEFAKTAAAVPAPINATTAALNSATDATTKMSIAWNNHKTVLTGLMEAIRAQVNSYAVVVAGLPDTIARDLGSVMVVWSGHVTGVTGQIAAIRGVIDNLALQYASYPQKVGEFFGQVMVEWGGHLTGLNGFVSRLKDVIGNLIMQYMAYPQKVGEFLGQSMVVWGGHLTGITGMVGRVKDQIGNLIAQYQAYPDNIGKFFGDAMVVWGGHITGIAGAIGQIKDKIGDLIAQYQAYPDNIGRFFGSAMITWGGHITGVKGAIGQIKDQIGGLIGQYQAYPQKIGEFFGQVIIQWGGHITGIRGAITQISTMINSLKLNYTNYRDVSSNALNQSTVAWRGLTQTIANAVSNANSQLSALSRTFVNVRGSALNAASGIQTLRNQIAALQSKTVTITTVHRTVNQTVTAAKGFSGIVNSQTNFTVGEGGRPEFVQVIPLAGSGGGGNSNTTIKAPTINNTGARNIPLNTPRSSSRAGGGTMSANLTVVSPVIVNGRELARATNKYSLDNISGRY